MTAWTIVGKNNRPALVGLFLYYSRFHQIIKHLLLPPAGRGQAMRAASPVRAFVPAADPETGTAPWPLQLIPGNDQGSGNTET